MTKKPPGGSANICGILYQMLWTLLRASHIKVNSYCEDGSSATIIVEPKGGGGDLHTCQESSTTVEQLKSCPTDKTWALRETIEKILPDLYKAIDLGVPNTSFRLVTEGKMGGWKKVAAFFSSLSAREVVNDDYESVLDNVDEIPFSHQSSLFWTKDLYTEYSLFEHIVDYMESKTHDDRNLVRQKLWHMLSNFKFLGGQKFSEIENHIDELLISCVESDEDLPKTKNALITELSRQAAIGGQLINSDDLFKKYGLDVIPLSKWNRITEEAHLVLSSELKRLGYDPSEDVRKETANSILKSYAGKPVLLLTGESGTGKSWTLYSLANSACFKDQLIAIVEATGDADRDQKTIADVIWQDIIGHSSEKNLNGIFTHIRTVMKIQSPITILIDGVQSQSELQALLAMPWWKWGITVIIACLSEALEINSRTDGVVLVHSVRDFSNPELYEYLQIKLGSKWASIPFDVRDTLHRPLLASMYCDLSKGKKWHPTNEYELYESCWKRLSTGQRLLSAKLRKLSFDLLKGDSYPWTTNRLLDAGIDETSLECAIRSGWLRSCRNEKYEIWHDRLLNWSVAEAIHDKIATDSIDNEGILRTIKELEDQKYSGKYLGYVPMDLVWILLRRSPERNDAVRSVILGLESKSWDRGTALYKRLLPTIGTAVLNTVFGRLRDAIENDNIILSNMIIESLDSFDSRVVSEKAYELLNVDSPFMQRAGARILAKHPNSEALDRLWEWHCKSTEKPEKFARTNESKNFVYSDFFDALKSCAKLSPKWLERRLMEADNDKPVHDLVYLIPKTNAGKDIWERNKKNLFSKIEPPNQRALAFTVARFRDTSLKEWIIDCLEHSNPFVKTTAFWALSRMEPDLAIERLTDIPSWDLYLSRGWSVIELLVRRPKETLKKVREIILESSDTWDTIRIFQGYEDYIDEDILPLLLDSLEQLLSKEIEHPSPSNKHPLWFPLDFMSNINISSLIRCFEHAKASKLEEKLCQWLIAKVPSQSQWVDHEFKNGMNILMKIGGKAYVQTTNALLESTQVFGRLEGYKYAKKRSNQLTHSLLETQTQSEELYEDIPLEQNEAAEALAYLGRKTLVVKAIVKLGLSTFTRVTEHRFDECFTDEDIYPAISALESNSEHIGGLFALGVCGCSDKAELLRGVLEKTKNEDVATACIISLGLLQDKDPVSTDLISAYLNSEKHRYVATNALLNIMSDYSLDKLLSWSTTQKNPEDVLVYLLSFEHSYSRALERIRKYLADMASNRRKLSLLVRLYKSPRGAKIRNDLFTACDYQDVVREGASIDEKSTSWTTGLKANSIELLSFYDRDTSFELAWETLLNQDAHDREYYPYILIRIDKKKAIPFLLEQLGRERATLVISAICRAIRDNIGRDVIYDWLKSPENSKKRAACWLAGWFSKINKDKLIPCLDDEDTRIANAALESLKRLKVLREANELLAELKQESVIDRKWVLLEAFIEIVDPGDKHILSNPLVTELWKSLPNHMNNSLGEMIKKKADKVFKKTADEDRKRKAR